MGVLTLAAGADAEVSPLGIGLALLAGAGYAAYTVVAKRLLRLGHDPVGVMAGSFGLGALVLLPVLALGDRGWLTTPSGSPSPSTSACCRPPSPTCCSSTGCAA